MGPRVQFPPRSQFLLSRVESDWRSSLLVRIQTLRLTFFLGHLGAGALVMSCIYARTRLRSHTSTLSHVYALTQSSLHFPACLSLCKLTVQTGNPKRSGIGKLSSFSVMPHPPRVSCNALYLRCRLTKHIACNHLQAICVGYMWDGCGLLV